jgi:hypothetical protein
MLLITLACCGEITETCFDDVSSEARGLEVSGLGWRQRRDAWARSCYIPFLSYNLVRRACHL